MSSKHLLLLVLTFGFPAWATADTPVETDRPDFTESTSVVDAGHLQIESGLTHQRTSSGHSWSGPELLFRYGLPSNFELRLGAPDYNFLSESEESKKGFGDTYIGLKVALPNLLPIGAFALIPAINLPSRNDIFSSNSNDPELKVCWSSDLSKQFSISLMSYGLWTSNSDRERRLDFQQTASLAQSVSDSTYVFYEYAGTFERSNAPSHIFHTGIAHHLSIDTQVDLHIGFNLNGGDRAPFIGAGYAVKL